MRHVMPLFSLKALPSLPPQLISSFSVLPWLLLPIIRLLSLPSQPTAPTVVAASPPRILIDSFYAELNAKGYKFVEPEHPPEAESEHSPEVAAAPSKVRATINLKILINGNDLNTTIAEEALNAPKTPKAIKALPIKLKILMNGKDIALAMAEAAEAAAPATAAVQTTSFKKSMLPVDVDPEVKFAIDLLKEMYNEVEACDAVAFIKSLVAPTAAIDLFVLCNFTASSSNSAAFVPPSTSLPNQPTGPPLPPQFTGPLIPPQPTLAPIAVVASPSQIPIDSFYVELNAMGYKFVEPEHPPEVEPEHTLHPPKPGLRSTIKYLSTAKTLTQPLQKKPPQHPKSPKALKAPPIKLKILINGKDISLNMAEVAEVAAAATASVPTPSVKKSMLPVNVDPEVESAVDLLKEMYNEVVAAAILKSSEVCDAVTFFESLAAPAAPIDFFVPTLPPTSMATSPPQILIDSFYAKLNAKEYKFAKPEHPPEAEPEHPPEVTDAPSKVGATINLKILINNKDLNMTVAEGTAATPQSPQCPLKPPKLLKPSKPHHKTEDFDEWQRYSPGYGRSCRGCGRCHCRSLDTTLQKPMLSVDVDPEVESTVDLLKEMYNEAVVAAILKSPIQLQIFDDSFNNKKISEELMLLVDEACDVVAFIESPAAPATVIDFFVLCAFMAPPSDSAASVPPSTPLPPQPTGLPLPPQPMLAPTAVGASHPRIPIDTFYAELNAEGYKFVQPEHPLEAEPEHSPKVDAATSKVRAAINLKILINGKNLNTAIAKDTA
ncbi:PREDICTED: uncharacterized protein [Prunus dulcis]|uniref:PREDICTED: uncharacterized protein n=1 Tax=Prunus dulcis TaxID=3755 RepID=A0A5E4ED23_PRUDU|nr:PREDICTED: uncharacterized protein [Prunus dulcis]